jgi:hypothetical protein
MSSCGICGGIGPQEKWAEGMGGAGTPAPPNFERLEWTGLHEDWFSMGNVYRCGECGAWFFLTIGITSSLASTDYDDYTLTRGPRETTELLTQQCCQLCDFASLEQLLDDEGTRLDALRTLAALVTERDSPHVRLERAAAPDARETRWAGTDLTPLEPRLKGFLSGPPKGAEAAALVLARHLLRQARTEELQSLFASGGSVQAGAMQAMQDARRDRWGGSGAHEAVRALMLRHVRARDWMAARALIRDLDTLRVAAEAIRDVAQGTLDAGGPVDLRSPLERALRAASRTRGPEWAVKDEREAAAAALEAVRKA